MKKKFIVAFMILAAIAMNAKAQVNLQGFYDFGRKHVTTTLEMFKPDDWGNTFFFVDIDYNYRNDRKLAVAPSGAYLEFARCLNFWQKSKAEGLNIHLEFDAGLGIFKNELLNSCGYPINNAALGGLNYCWHNSDYRYVLNFEVLYKYIFDTKSLLPMQFTFVWTCKDLFTLKGLQFSGFVDFWWQDLQFTGKDGLVKSAKYVILSEPQIWYSVGQWFHCENLNIGGEVELSYNFANAGFRCNPCVGFKWVF